MKFRDRKLKTSGFRKIADKYDTPINPDEAVLRITIEHPYESIIEWEFKDKIDLISEESLEGLAEKVVVGQMGDEYGYIALFIAAWRKRQLHRFIPNIMTEVPDIYERPQLDWEGAYGLYDGDLQWDAMSEAVTNWRDDLFYDVQEMLTERILKKDPSDWVNEDDLDNHLDEAAENYRREQERLIREWLEKSGLDGSYSSPRWTNNDEVTILVRNLEELKKAFNIAQRLESYVVSLYVFSFQPTEDAEEIDGYEIKHYIKKQEGLERSKASRRIRNNRTSRRKIACPDGVETFTEGITEGAHEFVAKFVKPKWEEYAKTITPGTILEDWEDIVPESIWDPWER